MSKKEMQTEKNPKEKTISNWKSALRPEEAAGRTTDTPAPIGGDTQYLPPSDTPEAEPFSLTGDFLDPFSLLMGNDNFNMKYFSKQMTEGFSAADTLSDLVENTTIKGGVEKLFKNGSPMLATIPFLSLKRMGYGSFDTSLNNPTGYIADNFLNNALPDLLSGEYKDAFKNGALGLMTNYVSDSLDDTMGPPVRDENGIQQVNSSRILAKTALSFASSLKDGPFSTILSTTSGLIDAIVDELDMMEEESVIAYQKSINEAAANISADYLPALDGAGYDAFETALDVAARIPPEPFSPQEVVFPSHAPNSGAAMSKAGSLGAASLFRGKGTGGISASNGMAAAGNLLSGTQGSKTAPKRMADGGANLSKALLGSSNGSAPLAKGPVNRFSAGAAAPAPFVGGRERAFYAPQTSSPGQTTYSMPPQPAASGGGGGGGNISVTVTGNQFAVREEEDLDRIARGLAAAIRQQVVLH